MQSLQVNQIIIQNIDTDKLSIFDISGDIKNPTKHIYRIGDLTQEELNTINSFIQLIKNKSNI